jgi:aminopeptidase
MEPGILDRLADLVVNFGANVQPEQHVIINSELGKEALTRAVAEHAYKAGALHVDVSYADSWIKRARILYGSDASLGYGPDWARARAVEIGASRGAVISLAGNSEPGVLEGLDPDRLARDRSPVAKESMHNLTQLLTNWSVIPCPTEYWAAQVYPDLEPAAALEKLWEQVAYMCRLDSDDPVSAWTERIAELVEAKTALEDRRFDSLHLSAPGTDLTIGLLPTSIWMTGALTTASGITHHANLPTEEIFTTPDPTRVDGVVRSTKPLEREGQIILGLEVEFRDGKAVRIDADQGAEIMRGYVGRDEGAARLGEVALVDGHGRIGPMDTVFWTTLIDENAASHIALGQGFDWAVGPEDQSRINRSELHIDFMIGSPEMVVTGTGRDGTTVPVLENGAWKI